MSPMELYVKFMFTLAFGLTGLAVLLTTLLETLFHDWDAVREIRFALQAFHRSPVESVRAEDILLELDRGRRTSQRWGESSPLDQRREALREMREAESRLSIPTESFF